MSISFPKPLEEEEERYYISLYEQGNKDAEAVLIERNLRLVAHIAKKYTSNIHTMDDFISIGTIGLIKAVRTFRRGKSTRLATYAAKCIENEILMSIRATKKNACEVSLNIPVGTDKDGNEISLNDILGTEPDEIADNLHLKMQIIQMLTAIEGSLTQREKDVIIHRYGLYGERIKTQREVALLLKISRSYVSRIEKKALEKLNAQLVLCQNGLAEASRVP